MRSEARETAFKIIFAELFSADQSDRFIRDQIKKAALGEEDAKFALRLVRLVIDNKAELTELMMSHVSRFAEHRIYNADKAILLLALAEIRYCDDVPPVVSVSEATDLARKYSTENSTMFVNGVLSGMINS